MPTTTSPFLTAEKLRRIRDNFQLLSNRPDGNVDLGKMLNDLVDALVTDLTAIETDAEKIVSGSLTVANGATFGTVAVGAEYNGKPIVASLAQTDTSATFVKGAVVSGGLAVVTIDQDPADAGGCAVYFIIDGR